MSVNCHSPSVFTGEAPSNVVPAYNSILEPGVATPEKRGVRSRVRPSRAMGPVSEVGSSCNVIGNSSSVMIVELSDALSATDKLESESEDSS